MVHSRHISTKKNVEKVIQSAIKLATKLRTPLVKLKLDFEEDKQAKIHQVTRWNSVPLMLQRVIDLKEFCQKQQDQELFKDLAVDSNT